MRIVFAFVLLIGLGLAGTAAYMVMQRFNQYETDIAIERRNQAPQIELTQIAVAAHNLEFAKQLRASDVQMIKWPADSVPAGAFKTVEAIMGTDGTKPRTILAPIVKDEALLGSKLTNFGEDAGIRSRLAPGMRAFTIGVNVTTGVAGFLQPNDRVDIYWSGDSNGQAITKLILEKVKLIAIDQSTTGDSMTASVARNVTAEVSPQVVAELTQAQRTGQLTLSLRGVEDAALTGAIQVDQTNITGIVNKAVVAKPVCTIRTRKGGVVTEIETPCPTN